MKKFSMLFLAAAVALVGAIVAPTKAEAVPAFARQVGVPCYSCHYQHIPKLNAFGRDFKLGGFTQAAQDLIQDDGLSLPPVLNAAVVVKIRLVNQSPEATGKKYGEWNIPDEAAILIGGRVGENMGALNEFSGDGHMPNNKFVFSKDFGGVRGGLTVFSTADAGPAYGMELFQTGNQRNQFGYEVTQWHPRAAMNGPWNNGAQGLGFFAGSDMFFVNVSLFAPAASSFSGTATGGNYDVGFNLSNYIRAAITPKIGDMDLAVGVSLTSGKTKIRNFPGTAAGTDTEIASDSMMVDGQLQMPVAGMSLEVIANYATVKSDAQSIYNATGKDNKGFSVGAELGITHHAGLKAGFGSFDNGAATRNAYTATFIGGWWAVAQNVDLTIDVCNASGDAKPFESKMIVMLEYVF